MRELLFGEGGDTATGRVASGVGLPEAPHWSILELGVGPDNDGCLPNDDTCGCSDPLHFGDQMLFSKATLLLRSIRWKIPEQNSCEASLSDWLGFQAIAGLPKLDHPSNFHVPVASVRAFLPETDVLLVLFHHSELTEPWRLVVANDLEMLVDGNTSVGWMLQNASTHLISPVSARASSLKLTGSIAARSLLAEFLGLVDDDFVTLMTDQDPAAHAEIGRLRDRARSGRDGVDQILAEWADDILSRFYE